jgi:hypothetical protein
MCGARIGVHFECGEAEGPAGPMGEPNKSQAGHRPIAAVIRDLDLVHRSGQDLSVSECSARA